MFEVKGAKKARIFSFLNGRFSIMGGPMDMVFGVFSEIKVKLLKSIISHFRMGLIELYKGFLEWS